MFRQLYQVCKIRQTELPALLSWEGKLRLYVVLQIKYSDKINLTGKYVVKDWVT